MLRASPLVLLAGICVAGCPSAPPADPSLPPPSGTPTSPEPVSTPPDRTAAPTASAPAPQPGPRAARLTVDPRGALVLDGTAVNGLDALEQRLRALVAEEPTELVLAVAPGTAYERVAEIFERARRAGISAVNVERATPPSVAPTVGPPAAPTVSSGTGAPPGTSTPAALPSVNSGNAGKVTPPAGFPSPGTPDPVTPPPIPPGIDDASH